MGHGDAGAAVAIDSFRFFDNPSCQYLGKPAPPAPTPPTPPAPPGSCSDFSGDWIDNPHWFTPEHFTQSNCVGSFRGGKTTYTVAGSKITTSKEFYNGLTGVLNHEAKQDAISWANGARWE